VTDNSPGIVILGPTASGKTRLGIDLALMFDGEILSCDALQVYRLMDIGTAKASSADLTAVRHHMIDLRDPDEDFSAGDYQRVAREALRMIRDRGRIPFVVGGSGFYLRALIDGLFEGPARAGHLRARMLKIVARKGPRFLHRALERVDPESAARISEADASRIIRAYEVYLISGKSISSWQRQPRDALLGYRWLKLGIDVPREILYRRIDERVEAMFQKGLVDEVRRLLERFPKSSHAFKAIGYRQVTELLEGKLSTRQAIEETQRESRRYAKRQLTWFRSDPHIVWLDGKLDSDEIRERAAVLVSELIAN